MSSERPVRCDESSVDVGDAHFEAHDVSTLDLGDGLILVQCGEHLVVFPASEPS